MTSTGSGSPLPADDSPVGARLASFRRRAGLTGHELAARTGMTQSRISRLETGAVLPDPAAVRRIAEALGLSPQVLEELVARADGEHNRMQDVRPDSSLTSRQTDLGELERKGKV